MKQQINYDIAWQIFDEVNQYNDTDKFIDLNCLELSDARAITKQKIYDVALLLKENKASQAQFDGPFESKNLKTQNVIILTILCGDEQVDQQFYNGNANARNGNTSHINGIMDTIKNELKLEHQYITQQKLVLVRVDQETLNNSVLNDW